MALPDKTLLEMHAGAMAIANGLGHSLDDKFLESIARTYERMEALNRWQKEGKLRIERHAPRGAGADYPRAEPQPERRLYYVGDEVFEDDDLSLMSGAHPSELLVARIALAIGAFKRED